MEDPAAAPGASPAADRIGPDLGEQARPTDAGVGPRLRLDALPALPDHGVAVDAGETLVFVALDGNVQGHVPDAALSTVSGLHTCRAGCWLATILSTGPPGSTPSAGSLGYRVGGAAARRRAVRLDPGGDVVQGYAIDGARTVDGVIPDGHVPLAAG